MSLVFAGICSHAPGITGRIHMADEDDVRTLQSAMNEMRASLKRAKPDALIVIAAEHFANFFMDNMPPTAWEWQITTTVLLKIPSGSA